MTKQYPKPHPGKIGYDISLSNGNVIKRSKRYVERFNYRAHPSLRENYMGNKEQGIVSSYQGRKIPTRRKALRNQFEEVDPPNSRLQALLGGELDVTELDEEEIAYGVTRADDGKFGEKAAFDAAHLPKGLKDKIQKELIQRANGKMNGSLLKAIDSIVDIATSDLSDDKDRFKAAQYILERVQGKTPDVVQVSQDKPWEMVLNAVEAGSRQHSREARGIDNAVDAEVVEQEGDDNDTTR